MADTNFIDHQTPIITPWLQDVNDVVYKTLGAPKTVAQAITNLGAQTASYTPAGTGAVSRTITSKLGEVVSVKDFGAKGDGVTDDTVAIQNALNTGLQVFFPAANYLVSSLTVSTGGQALLGYGATITQKTTITGTSEILLISASNVSILGLTIDGNQSNFSSSQVQYGIYISGNNPTLRDVTVHNTMGQGLQLSSIKEGTFENCHFDDNAGLGMEANVCSYLKFTDCTFNRNGFGFHVSFVNSATNVAGGAFGVAIRFRSHHINFVSCMARDNGRDGFNINQGSYGIKFIGCVAHGNFDGGFTLAADNTNSAVAGNSESPYDVTYVDCEAYNNYSSGLAAYCAVYDIHVRGGRYYNNHRLAGDQAPSDSFCQGLYFAASSRNIYVDTAAYDDRQSATVSSVSGSVVTVNSWKTGTINNYPKVAFFDASGNNLGYAKVTAETGTSITVTPTSSNGVNLANITNTCTVSQAVQHNGFLASNGSTGEVNLHGYGHTKAVNGYTGGARNVVSGWYNNYQNIKLVNRQSDGRNLILNSTFDTDASNWSFSTPGGIATAIDTTTARSAGAAKVSGGTGTTIGDATLVSGSLNACKDAFVRLGAWVYSATPGAYLFLYWQIGGSTFQCYAQHPGDGTWRWLECWAYIGVDVTACWPRIQVGANGIAYYDNLVMDVHKEVIPAYNPSSRSLSV